MFDLRAMYGARFDGLEAMLFALAFMLGVLGASALGAAIDIAGAGGLGAGFAIVWLLRRLRPTRAALDSGSNLGTRRSFASLLLLGVGWFVLVIAAFLVVIACAILADPQARDVRALLLPIAPLLLGNVIVYAGLRVGRTREAASPDGRRVVRPSESRATRLT